jgi:hypothetical protein
MKKAEFKRALFMGSKEDLVGLGISSYQHFQIQALSEDNLMGPPVADIQIVLFKTTADIETSEAAQLIRMQYPSAQIFLLCMGTLEVHWTALSKNGITDLFFLPDEAKRLGNNLLVDPLTPVKIMDLSVGKSLPFPTFYYLSQSDRILQLSVPDEIFSPGKITGLKAINTSTIFMNSKDIPLFKQYYSTQLSELELPPDISESESAWLAESTYLEFLKYIICRPELQIKLTEFKKRFSVVLQDTFSKSTEGQNWKQRVSALSGNTTSTV